MLPTLPDKFISTLHQETMISSLLA